MSLKMFQPKKNTPLSSIQSIIAVAAGKGGVGKSSVTANLAVALKHAGYAVGVMDTDLYGPSIRQMLPEEQMPTQQGELINPAIGYKGIKTISMAYFRKENEAMAVRAPIANGIIGQFAKTVNWGPLDFLLIDFPPGTGDIQITLSQQIPLTGALLVTTPQEVALMDVRKAANLFTQLHIPIIGIAENMSYYLHPTNNEKIHLFGEGGGYRLAQELGTPLLGSIPVDPMICRCGDEGKPLAAHSPQAPSVTAFEELAKALVAHSTALKHQSSDCLTSFQMNWKEMS